ncbi:putative metallopeptidase [Massilia aerilata]|uniref:Metallopeptidase n=1 Tax=Massilia aerilata TaxID=453817 RepID=A0ABW0S2M8_9BURK
MATKKGTVPRRPAPPLAMLESPRLSFVPAPDVRDWINETFLAEHSRLFNEEHAHVEAAHFEVLWASAGFTRQGRTVLGQCEQVTFRASAWQKGRQEQQMRDWFGAVPDFLITLDAAYSAQCSDLEFCALVEHELYHIGQERDAFGAPAFTRSGSPKLAIRGHDVEEFVGVVRRYGPSKDVQYLVDAVKRGPEVAKLDIARACGTCLLKLA